MNNLQFAIFVCETYNMNKSLKGQMVEFFKENSIEYSDILSTLMVLNSYEKEIRSKLDEINYQKQIEETGLIIPKMVEVIIERDFIESIENDFVEEVCNEENFYNIKENLILVSLTASSFQCRYCLVLLEEILSDSALWELEIK